jgi:hypothetical protein
VKHLIRPTIGYSWIPTFHETSEHPFVRQIAYSQKYGISGYNFDNNDIIPIDSPYQGFTNYFFPMGNALSYGVLTQVIRRGGAVDSLAPTYDRVFEFSAKHALNIREYFRGIPENEKRPLSNILLNTRMSYGGFTNDTAVTYIPYIAITSTQSPWTVTTNNTYVLERATHQRVLAYERSFNLGYSFNRTDNASFTSTLNLGGKFSITDYFMPRMDASFSFAAKKLLSWGAGLRFQSPSECWVLDFNLDVKLGPNPNNPAQEMYFVTPTVVFQMNWTGSGFSGFDQFGSNLINQAATGSGIR